MARCCGSTGSCACKMVAGRHTEVTGTGTAQDPFVIASTTALNTADSDQFMLILTGEGTLDSPWNLRVDYGPAAGLDNVPDVDAPAPANGDVLSWSDSAQAWVPAPPTTAAAGGNLTGDGIEGDGSAGAPLAVTPDDARFIQVTVDGVGLTDEAINRMVRPFPDATVRDAADPPPEVGTLSMLYTDPGRIDYWTGADWLPIDNGIRLDVQPGEMLALSGSYDGGTVMQRIQQMSAETDVAGDFEVLSDLDLTNYAGVLSVHVQELGEAPWKGVVRADETNGRIMCRAFRLDDGTAYAGYTLESVVTAWLY